MSVEDDYFEIELRNRLRDESKDNIDFKMVPLEATREDDDTVSNFTRKTVFDGLDEVLDAFFYARLGEGTDYDVIADRTESFLNKFTDKNIAKMYREHHFTDEEMDFMRYTTATHKWRGIREYGIDASYALRDILLREQVIKEFGEDALPALKRAAESLPNNYGFSMAKRHFSELFSEHPYGRTLEADLEKTVDAEADYFFNDKINCGGYSFKVDTCIEPPYPKSVEGKLAFLVGRFPFARLLDGEVAEDEYLVIYRAVEEGHHFIRVDSDGVVREKDLNNPPQVFDGWAESLADAYEAEFAVKKDHEMFDYDYLETNTCDRNLQVPEKVKEYVSTPRTRRPVIRGGRLVNYFDYVHAPTRRVEAIDTEDSR